MDEVVSDEDSLIRVPVFIEYYLRYRVEPLQIRAIFPLERDTFEMLDDEEDLRVFVDECIQSVLAVMDIRGEERYVFTDERMNKFIIKVDEVQAISVLAPDPETIQKLLSSSE